MASKNLKIIFPKNAKKLLNFAVFLSFTVYLFPILISERLHTTLLAFEEGSVFRWSKSGSASTTMSSRKF